MRKRPYYKPPVICHSGDKMPDIKGKPIHILRKVGEDFEKVEYLPLYCGYDVETTTIDTIDGHQSAVYSHALSIATGGYMPPVYVYHGRRWEDYNNIINQLIDTYDLSDTRRIIIWVANLSFEFAFLAYRHDWDEVFAKDTRQPLLARIGGIEYRECLAITGGNLAHLASNYCWTQKLVGDLDYSKPRNYDTPLAPQEMQYIVNDAVILPEFAQYFWKAEIKRRRKIPMTKTGMLLDDIKGLYKQDCKRICPVAPENADNIYNRYLDSCRPDMVLYYRWYMYLFRGGYVHANALYSGITIDADYLDRYGYIALRQYDITSSYPAVMLLDYVPVTPFVRCDYVPGLEKSKCLLLTLEFTGIKLTTHHTIESKSKIIAHSGAVWDNGRLVRADSITVMLTELDLASYLDYYQWQECRVLDCLAADRGRLPHYLLTSLTNDYRDKNMLKMQGKKDTLDYQLSKERVNSHYGACVKRIRTERITFDAADGWGKIDTSEEFEKELARQNLLPQWGIWITAHARRRLLKTVAALTRGGCSVVYCDTDSIKVLDNGKARRIIDKYNKCIRRHLYNRRYRSPYYEGLGGFDDEGDARRYKTLGAKRYLVEDSNGKIKATVAGMPKTAIKRIGDIDPFAAFDKDAGFRLDCEQSGKLTTAYTDEPYKLYVNGQWMEELSGVALYQIPFKITLKPEYQQYIETVQNLERIGDTV